jgi:hypothetical protein
MAALRAQIHVACHGLDRSGDFALANREGFVGVGCAQKHQHRPIATVWGSSSIGTRGKTVTSPSSAEPGASAVTTSLTPNARKTCPHMPQVNFVAIMMTLESTNG